MAIKFGMPSLGHTMEKGKVIEWLKREGETLAKGEPMVVIETDKVVTEVGGAGRWRVGAHCRGARGGAADWRDSGVVERPRRSPQRCGDPRTARRRERASGAAGASRRRARAGGGESARCSRRAHQDFAGGPQAGARARH